MRNLLRRPRATLARVRRAITAEVHAFWRRRPVRPDVVFYESFAGNGVLCNPEAIFRHLLSDPEFAGLTHIWALRSRRENRDILREFAGDPRVRFVRMRSSAYYRALATSGYLVNNATFPPEFSKRSGQIYLNTWHGTPLKRMGFDIGDPASRVANVIRNFLHADYLLSASPTMTSRLYESAHRLGNLFSGEIIEEGYPRIDRQLLDPAGSDAVRARLERAGVNIGGRRIILYAPTWKGTNFNRPDDDARELIARVETLTRLIDSERYVVLLKTHQVVHRFAAHLPGVRRFLVPNEVPTNELLGVADVLVTDYSSIFFDFLATGRPIVFLTPDIADYSDYRGLYAQPDAWPGPITTTLNELGAELNALDQIGRTPAVLARQEAERVRTAPREDGHATERVVDIVFRGRRDGYAVGPMPADGRTRILINAGGMRPNGITSSLISLTSAIDHSRFDVSVVFPTSRRAAVLAGQAALDPRVRQFARVGGMNGSKRDQFRRRRAVAGGSLTIHRTDRRQRALWDDEWTRCFGGASFDRVIDFSGYGAFWSTLLLHAPVAERSIWLHNDMSADAHRQVNGRERHLTELRAVFSLYPEYDHLVSVSPALAAINRGSLASLAPRSEFVFARNLVSVARVRAGAAVSLPEAVVPDEVVVPEWVRRLQSEREVITFVTVGRLSPEKNHDRLIRAFSVIHRDAPDTRLVVVGSGPLAGELDRLVDELGLRESVWLVGHQANPHAIMGASSCFVLSSDYEGQPMVLLEAMVVGLPIVTVEFGSVRDALPSGAGRVTARTVDGLAEGMRSFLAGEVHAASFDADEYNRAALGEFERAIGLRSVTS